ncbi:HU family DNA-binding protein [Desulfoferrobacter suflitae]|uniref:HU family DNA-binding protein n=1 Tax=Desulfoferrobacter suflitae TaxID=2865782 RepID=UPI0021645B9D|nr:HU family DNA-binding protein [Desulfoferrobacter suflitae]MCK8600129.1 HU family DNA-binding protein [Desulfoferrobacter suflitae]
MNKAELIANVAQKAGISKKTAEDALNAFTDSVAEAMADRDTLTLIGFGTFKVSERAERKGRNPRTGEELTIPAKKVVKFQPGKGLSERIQ